MLFRSGRQHHQEEGLSPEAAERGGAGGADRSRPGGPDPGEVAGRARQGITAQSGESQARNRYTFFASEARKAGYEQIAAIFLDTADNEKEHAKMFFKLLRGGEVTITAG